MNLRRLIISLIALLTAFAPSVAQKVQTDSITGKRYRTVYVPDHIVAQYAGNMGVASLGLGWTYGRNDQWETELLFGFLPKYHSEHAKATFTLKENFTPWKAELGKGWKFEPLRCGLYVNTVTGEEFWVKQAGRYPDKYYEWFSSKIRFNVFVGEGIKFELPYNSHKIVKSLTAFYEISTCDYYIRNLVVYDGISLGDVLSLSLGVRVNL